MFSKETPRVGYFGCGLPILILFLLLHHVYSVSAQQRHLLTPEVISGKNGLPQAFVPSIAQDRQGFIWMATRDGLCRYDGDNLRTFQPDPRGKPSLSFTGLIKMLPDREGKMWILTEKGSVDKFDPYTETFVNISEKPQYKRYMTEKYGYDIFVDSQSRLWMIDFLKGLFCLDFKSGKTSFYKIPVKGGKMKQGEPLHTAQDQNGKIWLATDHELFFLDRTSKSFERCPLAGLNEVIKNQVSIKSLQIKSGELLIGTSRSFIFLNSTQKTFTELRLPAGFGSGIVKAVTDAKGNLYMADQQKILRISPAGPATIIADFKGQGWDSRNFFIDKSQVLWVGTSGNGVRKFNLVGDQFQSYRYTNGFYLDWLGRTLQVPHSKYPVYPGFTTSYHFRYTLNQKRKKVWYTVGGEPAAIYNVGTLDGQISKVMLPPLTVENAHFYPVTEDGIGDVFTYYNAGILKFSDSLNQFQPTGLQVDVKKTGVVIQITSDKKYFWLCTSDNGLFRLDRLTGALKQYTHQPGSSETLSSNALFCVFSDPADDNRLWIGTFGSGLCAFDKHTGKSERVTMDEGLPNNVIYFAIPDDYGSLWIGTNKGLSQMNRKTHKIRNYTTEDGLMADEFNRFHYMQMPDGQILVGGIDGYTVFHPKDLTDDRFGPNVELVNMQINNRPVVAGSNSPFGEMPLQTLKDVSLPYHQNFLTFEYASLQFNETLKKSYRHQLVGVDKDWIVSEEPKAVYTELRPGSYVLRLNAANTSGIWSPSVRTLTIRINPPFWATWWAYVVYLVAVGALIFWLFKLYANRLQMKQENELRRREADQLRAADQMKTRFFSNITHEFRTPLTLIMTPAEQLKMKFKDMEDQKKLTSINRNANHLLELINQLLDLSKLEAGALPVHEVRGDLTSFVAQTVQLFEEQAEGRSIDLRFESKGVWGDYFFDADKIERIIHNLVFNALKFTGKGGQILVVLETSDAGLTTLRISDTGIGISKEKVKAIFDRFYQVDDAMPNGVSEGTGIGLSLVKEIVDLLKGTILVTSEVGKGTSFEISLPLKSAENEPLMQNDISESKAKFMDDPSQAVEAFDVLIVEDNVELSGYVRESLPVHYRVSHAYNGRQGLEMAVDQIPDLIISDVLMPEMDGLTLCGALKSNVLTSHIPVILLTAKSTFEDKMTGLEMGADDYLAKPFKVQELQLRVRNLLDNRRKQREWIHADFSSLKKKPASPQPTDKFLIDLYELMERHLDDSTFGVEQLSDRIGMSRIHLYRKIKTLTGFTATEFLRNYRLKQAVIKLQAGHPISEAGNMAGFDSPSYFAKCFRDLYGVSPTEFLAKSVSKH